MRLGSFLLSCLLAFLAGHMVNYSIIFLALQWFDSHALAGIGFGLCFGPPIILGWIAGVYCDRYSPRKILLIAQNSFFIALLLLWLASNGVLNNEDANTVQMILLLSAALFSGIGWSFVAPARFATLPLYVTFSKNPFSNKNKQKLTAATISLNVMLMMGFGLAPMLLKQIQVNYHWSTVFTSATVMFAISSFILLLLPGYVSHIVVQASKTRAFDDIKASLTCVKQSPYLTQLLLLSMVTYLLMGPMQVVLPSIAKDTLGLSDIDLGNYLSLIAFSLIIGGLLAMTLKKRGKLGVQLLITVLFSGLGIGILALVSNVVVSVCLLIFSACCAGIAISYIVAGLQHYSGDEHRGRIMSFYTIIGQVIPAISGIIAGILAQVLSPNMAMVIISAVIVALMLIAFITLKQVRLLESYSE